MSVIRAEELTKQYGSKVCVDRLSFELEKECVLGFIGPNGAGKTTTMRMLCGIMPPSSGRAFVGGLDVTSFPVEAKRLLGYLPENAPLPGTMTVEGFLKYCGNMRGLFGKELKTALERVTEECGLSGVLREEAEALSKGFRRRVCLAQAIMHQPEALVLDEPTDGLDPNQKREIRALIRELSRRGAVIVSTHILEEIDAVCDRVLTICGGKKVFHGTVPEFRSLAPESFSVTVCVKLPDAAKSSQAREELRKLDKVEFLSMETGGKEGENLRMIFRSSGKGEAPEKEVFALCAARNWEVLSVRTKDAGLDEVFSVLASGSGEEGKA
ncbi:MAG: ABC transporter ATP-binding protein [Lentisphaeria bacterium]|nr:ABC transporter ATP-binding protein [Lentisphaeria bacterium]